MSIDKLDQTNPLLFQQMQVPGWYSTTNRENRLRATNWLKRKACDMRNNPTPTEKEFALELQRQNATGWHIQYPLLGFIVDFLHRQSSLIVELDGGYHEIESQQAKDQARDAWIKRHEYKILRLKNQDVLDNPAKVVKRVVQMAKFMQR